MKELTVEAKIENLETVINFVTKFLHNENCSFKTITKFEIAIDELFSNIAYYAYKDEIGYVKVILEVVENPKSISLTLVDNGIPFDPLQNKDPNTSLPSEERKQGGLGIFMVKKSMDDISYRYENKQNILSIMKKI